MHLNSLYLHFQIFKPYNFKNIQNIWARSHKTKFVRESVYFKQFKVTNILEIGLMINIMDSEYILVQMAKGTKVNFNKDKDMEKENISIKMPLFMMDSGRMDLNKVKAYKHMLMELNILGNGNKIKSKDMEDYCNYQTRIT